MYVGTCACFLFRCRASAHSCKCVSMYICAHVYVQTREKSSFKMWRFPSVTTCVCVCACVRSCVHPLHVCVLSVVRTKTRKSHTHVSKTMKTHVQSGKTSKFQNMIFPNRRDLTVCIYTQHAQTSKHTHTGPWRNQASERDVPVPLKARANSSFKSVSHYLGRTDRRPRRLFRKRQKHCCLVSGTLL
jgi:hypothetical protein